MEKKKKTNPKLEAPKPLDVPDEMFAGLEGFGGLGGDTDHLTVKLALNRAPNHTNGKWQEGRVVWTADLDVNRALPAFCYATWSNPDASFQTEHFGRVILDGDELSEYCLWRSRLGEQPTREWESFLADLQPGPELKKRLEAFQFAAGPVPKAGATNQMEIGCKLLIDALPKATSTNSDSK